MKIILIYLEKYCRCRYILDQKERKTLLLYIRDLFNFGKINLRRKTNNIYSLIVSMSNPSR